MGSVRERTVATNGVELHVFEAGTGTPVVLAHGFPELAYSWRHQLPALAAAGCRVIAPDQRGYGRSSRPDAVDEYDIEHLTGDLVGLLDELGEERAIFVGHDWGSMVVSNMALLAPDRVSAIVNMSVPFLPRAPMPPVEMMRAAFADAFFYIVYFQEPGVADANLAADTATTMRRMLCGVSLKEGVTPDPANFANDGRGFVERMPEPTRSPHGSRKTISTTTSPSSPHRVHRWRQLVSQHGSQLAHHRAHRGCEGRGAVVVHRWPARPGDPDDPRPRPPSACCPITAARCWSTARALGAAGEAR